MIVAKTTHTTIITAASLAITEKNVNFAIITFTVAFLIA